MKRLATANENPNAFKMQATCDGRGWNQNGRRPCLALWEITANDIRMRKHTDYSGETDSYYGFVCPDCGCFTELDPREIPLYVRNNAQEYIACHCTKTKK